MQNRILSAKSGLTVRIELSVRSVYAAYLKSNFCFKFLHQEISVFDQRMENAWNANWPPSLALRRKKNPALSVHRIHSELTSMRYQHEHRIRQWTMWWSAAISHSMQQSADAINATWFTITYFNEMQFEMLKMRTTNLVFLSDVYTELNKRIIDSERLDWLMCLSRNECKMVLAIRCFRFNLRICERTQRIKYKTAAADTKPDNRASLVGVQNRQ